MIPRKDKFGKVLKEGDIVAEGENGKEIWYGKAVVIRRPLGVVVCHKPEPKSLFVPEESDFYDIKPLRTGKIKMLDKEGFMKNLDKDGDYQDLYLSTYDGVFQGWNSIEVIGSIYDFE